MTRPARVREADAGGATRLMVDPNFVIVTLMGGPVRPALAPKGEFLGARANSLSSTHWRFTGDPVLAFLRASSALAVGRAAWVGAWRTAM